MVEPSSRFLSRRVIEFLQRGTKGPELVGHDLLGLTMLPHCFLENFQRDVLVPVLLNETLQYLALMIHGPPQIVPLTVDLHEHVAKVPPPGE